MENPTNPIHIKMEHDEAISAKKDILQTEIEVLKIIKIMKAYNNLRSRELASKLKLYRKIRAIAPKIRKLNKLLPNIGDNMNEMPANEKIKKPGTKKIQSYDNNIDTELKDIQNRLNSLQQ